MSLAGALEDYLKAPDFEAQRLAYKNKKASKDESEYTIQGSPFCGSIAAHAYVTLLTRLRIESKQSQPAPAAAKKEEPVIDFFSSLDDELNALSAPSVQAQYNNTDPFGGFWTPDNNGGNPFAAGTNPFATKQQELQKQTQDINSQLAALQAGLSSLNQPANIPNPMVFGNQGFPSQQAQPLGFPSFNALVAQPQNDNLFTVENVFGNPSAFGGSGMGQSSVALGGGSTQITNKRTDPFADLGLVTQAPSQNPTLDPFNLQRNQTSLAQTSSPHNPFSQPSTSFGGFQQSTSRPPLSSQPSGFGVGQPNYVATIPNAGLSGLGTSGSNLMSTPFGVPQTAAGMGAMGGGANVAFNPFAPAGSAGGMGQQSAGAFNPFMQSNPAPAGNPFGAQVWNVDKAAMTFALLKYPLLYNSPQ